MNEFIRVLRLNIGLWVLGKTNRDILVGYIQELKDKLEKIENENIHR